MPSRIRTPEQQAIAKLDAAWSKAAKKKDIDSVVAFYSSKGSVVWPEQKARHGTKAIRTAWERAYKDDPKLSLTFEPERIDIASSGDIAVDFGSVSFRRRCERQIPRGLEARERRMESAVRLLELQQARKAAEACSGERASQGLSSRQSGAVARRRRIPGGAPEAGVRRCAIPSAGRRARGPRPSRGFLDLRLARRLAWRFGRFGPAILPLLKLRLDRFQRVDLVRLLNRRDFAHHPIEGGLVQLPFGI